MTILNARILRVAALASLLGLAACDESTPVLDTDTGAEPARVTFGVASWGQDAARKALIDTTRTQSIRVSWWRPESMYTSLGCASTTLSGPPSGYDSAPSALLSPDNPTHVVSLPAGNYCFRAEAYSGPDDGTGNPTGYREDETWTGGTLLPGENDVALTFLQGVWTFVDSQGNPAPIELSAASGGRVLEGFSLSPWYYGDETGLVAKAGFAGSRPFGMMEIAFDWGTEMDGVEVSNVSALAQFSGGSGPGSNRMPLWGGDYNLTQGCTDVYGDPCEPVTGDVEVALFSVEELDLGEADLSTPFPLPAGSISPDISQYGDTRVVDGETITGYLVETVYLGRTVSLVQTAAAAGVAKTAAPSTSDRVNPLTVTTYEFAVCGTDRDGDGTIDVGDWTFTDSYIQLLLDDGTWRCYSHGYLPTPFFNNGNYGNPGEYSWGVEQTGSDPGECITDLVEKGFAPYCRDRNGDGVVDPGDYVLRHYVRIDDRYDARFYPFTAKGSPLPAGISP